MRCILIIAVLLIFSSCDKTIYTEDNSWHCWACEFKRNSTITKFDTCFYGSRIILIQDSSGSFMDGFCVVK